MKNFNTNLIALALGFAFSTGSMAVGISKADYKAGMDTIAAEYKTAKAACAPLSGNPSDICVAEAKGKEKVAKAELESSYKPSVKTHYKTLVAKAEAVYAVANEKCDDLAGNAKDVCVKEAKAARTAAEVDAKAQMKTSNAKTTANEKTVDARSDAKKTAADASKDAAADKVDAQYKVAKEKCDTLAGNTKDVCVKEAKARFGK